MSRTSLRTSQLPLFRTSDRTGDRRHPKLSIGPRDLGRTPYRTWQKVAFRTNPPPISRGDCPVGCRCWLRRPSCFIRQPLRTPEEVADALERAYWKNKLCPHCGEDTLGSESNRLPWCSEYCAEHGNWDREMTQ